MVGITIPPGLGHFTPSIPFTYSGSQALTIDANWNPFWGHQCGCAEIFRMTVRGSLTLDSLAVLEASGVAVKVIVPEDAVGIVGVTVTNSFFIVNQRHSLLVTDLPAYLADESTTSDVGSAASIRVEVSATEFSDNAHDRWDQYSGFIRSRPDQDGIRVVEGGDGDATVVLNGLTLRNNGHDDVHVDERGNGSVDLRVDNTHASYTATRTDSGTGDVVRVTETGAGNLVARVYGDTAYWILGQFLDARENGSGYLTSTIGRSQVQYAGYRGPGGAIQLREDDVVVGGGNLTAYLTDAAILDVVDEAPGTPATPLDPLRAALVLHEKGSGSIDGRLTRTPVLRGAYGGVSMIEEGVGRLRGTIRWSTIESNANHGVLFDERGSGDLVTEIAGGSLVGNGGVAVRAEQQPTGFGSLTLTGVLAAGNAGGDAPVTVGAVTVTILP